MPHKIIDLSGASPASRGMRKRLRMLEPQPPQPPQEKPELRLRQALSTPSREGENRILDCAVQMLRSTQVEKEEAMSMPEAHQLVSALRRSDLEDLKLALSGPSPPERVWKAGEAIDACGIARCLVDLSAECLEYLRTTVGPLSVNSPIEVALAQRALTKSAEADRAVAALHILSPNRQLHLAQKLIHRAAKRRARRRLDNDNLPVSVPPRNPFEPRALFTSAPTAAST